MTRESQESLRQRQGKLSLRLANVVRLVSIADASALEWVLEGLVDDDGNREDISAQVYSNVGFLSRPRTGVETEAVVLNVGGDSNSPLQVGSRDPALNDSYVEAEGLEADQTVLLNSSAHVKVTGNSVEVKSHGGAAVELATKADVERLRSELSSHTHTISSGSSAGTTTIPIQSFTAPDGTSVLKGE